MSGNTANARLRHDWTREEVLSLFALPFNDLMFQAQQVHRANFSANEVQISSLLSIKTGGCAEDCKYCPQSAHYETGVKATKLMDKDAILTEARKARDAGASRFCMGAAWRELKDRDVPHIVDVIESVKAEGLETCMTLGMLEDHQAEALAEAGLDYYNHNIDTSPEFYGNIITTRTFQDRLETLERVRNSGMKTCCGGIVGMGEGLDDRAGLLQSLANLPEHPESVPINLLVQVDGTPLDDENAVEPLDFVRTIAVARILMPGSYVRLSAGREHMSDELQAMSFLAGANSIFYGETLLTTPNPSENEDMALFAKLGITPHIPAETAAKDAA